jgi:Ca2+-transporting ATPase
VSPGPGPVTEATARPPAGLTGLTSQEAAERLARDGPNRVVSESRSHRWRRLAGPLADPMVALLLVAAPTYLLIGETTDAIVAFAAIVPIAGVGWLLEVRASRTLDRLRELTAPAATVWRDGERQVVRAEDLVVGDLAWLHEGDVVPADARVVEATQLQLDESALTGEPLPAEKAPDGEGDGGAVWAGTTVLSGRGVVRVAATGATTRFGQIGTLVAAVRAHPTPLQAALTRLVRALAVVAAVFCVAVMAAELLHGHGWGHAVIAAVSLAIAAIPEEFSMVYGLYLALGAWRLSRERALVRNLAGVETLGSATVICTDKTGTLTAGHLAVTTVTGGDGAAIAGDPSDERERALIEAAVLACEPEPYDPLDVAIVGYARQHGVDVDAVMGGALVADWPFDPADKYLTHLWRVPTGGHRVVAKGSLEGLLLHVAADPTARAALEAANERLSADGMRVVAVAVGDSDGPSGDRGTDEAPLELGGLVAFSDPVREGVAAALEECGTAGIRVVLITGDHPSTAHAVVEGLGLPHEVGGVDLIATGADLDAADPAELDRLAGAANVFARTRPDHKHLLIEALRAQGEVVAMTGDGINDAPALRAADIGVAMGERGTAVAREAATLVLLDDNFATIVGAVRNGRRIYDNLSRAFAYLVAFHPPLLFAALLVPLLGKPLLLLPIHLVTLELLLHPVVSLVFQADPAAPDVMTRPPRRATAALGLRALWRPYAVGCTLAVAVIGAYLGAIGAGWPSAEARAFGFVVLLASQPFLVLISRSPDEPMWRSGIRSTRTLLVAMVVMVAVTAAVVYVAPIADLLQLEPFAPATWLGVLALAAGSTLWTEPLKAARHRRLRRGGGPTGGVPTR